MARRNHEIVMASENDTERKCTLQMLQGYFDRFNGTNALLHFFGDEVHHRFSIGVGLELVALGLEL